MRKLLLVVASLSLVVASGCVTPGDEETEGSGDAIVGGTATSSVPAIGYLVRDGFVFCTGTLIAPDVVLTAAHCVDGKEQAEAKDGAEAGVAFGIGEVEDRRRVRVSRWVMHPDYPPEAQRAEPADPAIYAHDMAYVLLDEPIEDVPLAKPRRTKHRGACNYVATGYGISQKGYRAKDGTYTEDEIGQRASLAMCADAGYELGVIRAYNGKRGSICQGDSGSPLRISNTREIVGVLSYNRGLCDSDERAFYAPIAGNLAFVDEALAAGR